MTPGLEDHAEIEHRYRFPGGWVCLFIEHCETCAVVAVAVMGASGKPVPLSESENLLKWFNKKVGRLVGGALPILTVDLNHERKFPIAAFKPESRLERLDDIPQRLFLGAMLAKR
jgi:hypothetical protein